MKKFITLLALMIALLYAISGSAQQTLNNEARSLKEKLPEYYIPIRNAAIEKWDQKHYMIVYEINQQSKAFLRIVDFVNSQEYMDKNNQALLVEIMSNWMDAKQDWTISKQGQPLTWKIDWVMVDFELKNNLKAKSEY